jgi:hypothetical protein
MFSVFDAEFAVWFFLLAAILALGGVYGRWPRNRMWHVTPYVLMLLACISATQIEPPLSFIKSVAVLMLPLLLLHLIIWWDKRRSGSA